MNENAAAKRIGNHKRDLYSRHDPARRASGNAHHAGIDHCLSSSFCSHSGRSLTRNMSLHDFIDNVDAIVADLQSASSGSASLRSSVAFEIRLNLPSLTNSSSTAAHLPA